MLLGQGWSWWLSVCLGVWPHQACTSCGPMSFRALDRLSVQDASRPRSILAYWVSISRSLCHIRIARAVNQRLSSKPWIEASAKWRPRSLLYQHSRAYNTFDTRFTVTVNMSDTNGLSLLIRSLNIGRKIMFIDPRTFQIFKAGR